MAITLATRVERSSEPVSAAAGDSLMMFSVERGSYFGLNEVASAIWKKLESPVAVGALCAELRNEFEVAPERCESEVLAFLEKLEKKGLVRIVG
jgi:hypothetical protein